MSKIRIKNFGPIKEGFVETLSDGTINEWIDIKKVTVLIGNQGSGKSTVAKLISTFMWLEKAMIRGDVNANISASDFVEMLAYHRMEDYFHTDSVLEYKGLYYTISLQAPSVQGNRSIAGKKHSRATINLPKIMYVPAERNFLSAIKDTNKISNLLAGSLSTFAVEYRRAQLNSAGKSLPLPINSAKIRYDEDKDETILTVGDKPLKLSSAASGFHSVVPLYWVSKNILNFIHQDEKKLLQTLSTDQIIRRERDLKLLHLHGISESESKVKISKVNSRFFCRHFVNIVEEPEQNLFPSSQKHVLESLMEFNNSDKENKLVITTHSPYLITYISLAVKADDLKEKVKSKELKDKLNEIVPIVSTINPEELVIYELNESNGTIRKLGEFEGIPSDKNYLNRSLREGNELFDLLLEIEEEL
ncbi:MAG: ATP-binding protein [Bacteroidia bacterium]|nr:ATP-binding protein [Bacteroidia bacterium]MCF8446774.1 ATP-binding protein [Bacteroidia bacterium]